MTLEYRINIIVRFFLNTPLYEPKIKKNLTPAYKIYKVNLVRKKKLLKYSNKFTLFFYSKKYEKRKSI